MQAQHCHLRNGARMPQLSKQVRYVAPSCARWTRDGRQVPPLPSFPDVAADLGEQAGPGQAEPAVGIEPTTFALRG